MSRMSFMMTENGWMTSVMPVFHSMVRTNIANFPKSSNWNTITSFTAAGEYSVHYEHGLKQFIAVYSESFLISAILARTAPTPSGPWSEPVKLYTVPEMDEQTSNIFCYSGKVHPGMSGRNYFVLSYVCNSFNMTDVIQNATLYMPKFIRINYF